MLLSLHRNRYIPRLVKYVVVNQVGWLDMSNDPRAMRELSARYPGTHVEKWTYYEKPDGTHESPIKEALP